MNHKGYIQRVSFYGLLALTLSLIVLNFGCNMKRQSKDQAAFQDEFYYDEGLPAMMHSQPARDSVPGRVSQDRYILGDLERSNPNSNLEARELRAKIIKNGRMSLQMKSVEEAKLRVDALLDRYGAYYSKEELSNPESQTQDENQDIPKDKLSYQLQIRVPSQQFKSLVGELQHGFGTVLSKHLFTKDITEEFVDLKILQESKERYIERYYQLLDRADKIPDILNIQENIRPLEADLDRIKGRLRYLDNLVAFSTLDLKLLSQELPQPEPEDPNIGQKILQAIKQGWVGLIDFFILLTVMWPLLLFALIGGSLWFRINQRKKHARGKRPIQMVEKERNE